MEIDQEIFNIILAKSVHQVAQIEFRNAKFPYARGRCPLATPAKGLCPLEPPSSVNNLAPFPAAGSAPLGIHISPLKKLSAAPPPRSCGVSTSHSNVDDYICYILLTDLCARNIRLLKVQWTCTLAACFSSKIERLPRGGGLESSTLPSKEQSIFTPR